MPLVLSAAWQSVLLLVSAALAGGWLLLLWLVSMQSRQRHVRAEPATGALGPEPPAVAGMLGHGGRVGDEAAAATLLDLAARHVVELEQAGPQLSLCRIRPAGRAELAPYERRILSYLDALATDGVVPAPALAQGATKPAAWWRKLRAEVVADTRARGLSRPRWSPFLVTVLGVPAALPVAGLMVWLVSVTGAFPTLGSKGIVGGAIVGGLLGLALVRRLNTDRLTPAGRAAAGHWLGVRAHLAADPALASQPPAAVSSYGRALAYAAALGLAPVATRSLPIGAPGNPRIAWSNYGPGMRQPGQGQPGQGQPNQGQPGQWHLVHISYPRRLSWGTAPRQVLQAWLLAAVPAAALAWLFLAVIPGLPGIGWVALATVAVALAGAARAAADLTGARPVEGEVVKVRQQGRVHWIAVDDGTSSTVRAWQAGVPLFRQVSEGDIIRVRVSRIFGYVSGLELISHRPRLVVEASLPDWQRAEGSDRQRAVLASSLDETSSPDQGYSGQPGAPAWSAGLTPGLNLGTLVTAQDAAGLLGAPVSAAQTLNPFEQIPGAAGNPLTRNAALAACRWTASDGRSVDVFAGSGLGARALLGQLGALAQRTGHQAARPERGGRLGPGVMLTGNMLVIAQHGASAAVLLRDLGPQAAGPVLERFAPVLAGRLAGTAAQKV
jgi:Predicted membrane protein (DUF2207)